MALHDPQEFQRPQPVRPAETVTPGYVLCYEYDGLGWCHGCEGRGRLPDPTGGRINCPACHRSRVCVICRGAAELAISQLSPASVATTRSWTANGPDRLGGPHPRRP